MKRNAPSFLTIDVGAANQFPLQLAQDGVQFVHGSNSASFEGVARFRALLCMEDIDRTPWFHRPGSLRSGERGYTVDACYRGQPIAKGVSLCDRFRAHQCWHYARLGSVGEIYPVLYGVDNRVKISESWGDIGHPVSKGSISIDYIRGIYVLPSCANKAARQLQCFGMGQLSRVVRSASIPPACVATWSRNSLTF